MAKGDAVSREAIPVWRYALAGGGTLAAGFTTLCCLGVSTALSIASSLGATFLTRDSSLKPALALALVIAVVAGTVVFLHHRHPGPLIATMLAGVWVYVFTFVVDRGSHSEAHGAHGHHLGLHGHHMSEPSSDATHAGMTSGQRALVWAGLTILVAGQLWNVMRARRGQRRESQLVDRRID